MTGRMVRPWSIGMIQGLIVTAVATANIGEAQETPRVEWEGKRPLTSQQEKDYERKAVTSYREAGLSLEGIKLVTACYEEHAFLKEMRLNPSIDFHFWDCNTNRVCEISFFVPDNGRLRYLLNYGLQNQMQKESNLLVREVQKKWDSEKPENRKGDFDTYILPYFRNKKETAIKKAEEIIRTLGEEDLRRWRFQACYYLYGCWSVLYYAAMGDYHATGWMISVDVADNPQLTLARYQNNVYKWPEPRNLELKISQEKARELSDTYLRKYYHKHEVPMLAFWTNRLEVVAPNYAFTPRHEGWEFTPTNQPTLVWTGIYNRTNTFGAMPVYIWVDAADGSMLGGYE